MLKVTPQNKTKANTFYESIRSKHCELIIKLSVVHYTVLCKIFKEFSNRLWKKLYLCWVSSGSKENTVCIDSLIFLHTVEPVFYDHLSHVTRIYHTKMLKLTFLFCDHLSFMTKVIGTKGWLQNTGSTVQNFRKVAESGLGTHPHPLGKSWIRHCKLYLNW